VPFYSTLSTVFFRRRYVSWPRKVCSGEGAICLNQGGMFHGYHDARRPLFRPCNNKWKTPASSGYKSQRMYCTWRERKKNEKGGNERGERRTEERTQWEIQESETKRKAAQGYRNRRAKERQQEKLNGEAKTQRQQGRLTPPSVSFLQKQVCSCPFFATIDARFV